MCIYRLICHGGENHGHNSLKTLFWDPKLEEATLFIGWESRAVWKNISQAEINLVQQEFEKIARKEIGDTSGNPFPLIFEGELNPE